MGRQDQRGLTCGLAVGVVPTAASSAAARSSSPSQPRSPNRRAHCCAHGRAPVGLLGDGREIRRTQDDAGRRDSDDVANR